MKTRHFLRTAFTFLTTLYFLSHLATPASAQFFQLLSDDEEPAYPAKVVKLSEDDARAKALAFLESIGLTIDPETLHNFDLHRYQINDLPSLKYVFYLGELMQQGAYLGSSSCKGSQGCVHVDAQTGRIAFYQNNDVDTSLPIISKRQAYKKAANLIKDRDINLSAANIKKKTLDINPGLSRKNHPTTYQFKWSKQDPQTKIDLPFEVSVAVSAHGEILNYSELILPVDVNIKPSLDPDNVQRIAWKAFLNKKDGEEGFVKDDWSPLAKPSLFLGTNPYQSLGADQALLWRIKIAPTGQKKNFYEFIIDDRNQKVLNIKARGFKPKPKPPAKEVVATHLIR